MGELLIPGGVTDVLERLSDTEVEARFQLLVADMGWTAIAAADLEITAGPPDDEEDDEVIDQGPW